MIKRDTVRKAKIFTFDTTSMLISNKNYTNDIIKKKYDNVKTNFLIPETRDIKVVTFFYNSEEFLNVIEKEYRYLSYSGPIIKNECRSIENGYDNLIYQTDKKELFVQDLPTSLRQD